MPGIAKCKAFYTVIAKVKRYQLKPIALGVSCATNIKPRRGINNGH